MIYFSQYHILYKFIWSKSTTYINFLSTWFPIETNITGAEEGAIALGTGQNMQDDRSFWYLGGHDETLGEVTDTIYFDTSAQIHPSEGQSMTRGRHSHCALNVKMDFPPFNQSQNQVWIIGGKNALKTVETYCQKQEGVNEEICSHNEDGLSWSTVSSLHVDRDGHTCAAFYHKNHGLAILVAYGYTEKSEMFLIEECSKCIDPGCEFECSWQEELDGISLDAHLPKRHDSKMVTLNGVPTVFGGVSFLSQGDTSSGEALNQVVAFQDVNTSSNDSNTNSWELLIPTVSYRQRHSVVSVPLDFICAEDVVSTSTERYRSFSNIEEWNII